VAWWDSPTEPEKVLAEVLPPAAVLAGTHAEDLVGNPTPVIAKHKFTLKREGRIECHAAYLGPPPECGTWWSTEGTSPTGHGRGWRGLFVAPPCWRIDKSAT